MDLVSGKTKSTEGGSFCMTSTSPMGRDIKSRAPARPKIPDPSIFKDLTVTPQSRSRQLRNPGVLANLRFGFSKAG